MACSNHGPLEPHSRLMENRVDPTSASESRRFVRIPTLKTVADFRAHVDSLGIELPCEDSIVSGPASPLAQPIEQIRINGKQIGNRFVVQPMEGWDGTPTGGITEDVLRRWKRFGQSGA